MTTPTRAREIALEQAVALAAAGKISLNEIIPTAEGFVPFLEGEAQEQASDDAGVA